MTDRNILVIDQGNHRTKLNFFRNGKSDSSFSLAKEDRAGIVQLVERLRPEGGIFSSVGDVDNELLAYLSAKLGSRLHIFSSQTPLPLRLNYRTPRLLGLDRIAAAVGARYLYPGENIVIADAGSALTVDAVAANTFLGGNISPGLYLRVKSLNDYTARLPLVEPEGELPRYGLDTETAIRCGAVRGAAAEIAMAGSEFFPEGEGYILLLTGGDAPRLLQPLTELNMNPIIIPEIVAYGLFRIYIHNENIN